jgi:hypothetical protein
LKIVIDLDPERQLPQALVETNNVGFWDEVDQIELLGHVEYQDGQVNCCNDEKSVDLKRI